MVKDRLVEPFRGTLAAPKALIITGALTMVMLAFEVLPTPPSVAVTCTLLFLTPAELPVTLTEKVQDPLAGKVPATRLVEDAPAVAVAVPPQVFAIPLGVAKTNPAGRASVNANPDSAMAAFGFCSVNVRLVTPPTGLLAAPKALLIVGGLATDRFAAAVFPVPPLVELTVPVVLLS